MKKVLLRSISVIFGLVIFCIGYISVSFMFMGVVSKGEKIPAYPQAKSALVVIDIQEGITGSAASFHTQGYVAQSEAFIQNVNQAIEHAQALNMPVIYIYQENTDWLFSQLMGHFLAPGTPGIAIDKRVKLASQNIFKKSKMDAFTNPQFEAFLQQKKINQLTVVGLDATQCVAHTIQGALNRGYAMIAIPEAIIAAKKEIQEKALKQYAAQGVIVQPLAAWLAGSVPEKK